MYTYNTSIEILCFSSTVSLVVLRTSSLKQLGEVGCSPASDGIPTLGDRETIDVAAMTASLEDVIKALVPLLVQPGVKPAKNRLAAQLLLWRSLENSPSQP